MSGDKVYCYPPDYSVLRNVPGYRDPDKLKEFERAAVLERIKEGVPTGRFDLTHLQAIHKQLFQDVYPWAGETRTTPLSKGESQFMPPDRIGLAMQDVHKRLEGQNYLKGLDPKSYAAAAGQIIGDVNFTHPFREGNGRTQMQYLKQLTTQAGHDIDLSRLDRSSWINASIEANKGEYHAMGLCIADAMTPERTRSGLSERAQSLLDQYKAQDGDRQASERTGQDRDNDRER